MPRSAPPSAATPAPDIDALWDYRDPAATEVRFRDLLPSITEAPRELELQTQIARTHSLRREFDAAHAVLDAVEARLSEGTPRTRVRYLLERGRTLNSSGAPEASAPLFEEAYAVAEASGEAGLAVDAAHMLGIVLEAESGLAWNLRAIEAAEASDDPRATKWLGALYNNTGHALLGKDDARGALILFEKGVAWRQAHGNARSQRIARWTVARAYRDLDRCEEALEVLAELQVAWAEAGEEDGYVAEEQGECLLALGRATEAAPRFAEAYRLLSQDAWLLDNEPARIARMAELGGIATGAD